MTPASERDRPIVVAGEALVDLLVRQGGPLEAHNGGGPYNAARTIGRLGQPAVFLGMLSDDVFGRGLRDSLGASGVAMPEGLSTPLPTTLALAEIDPHGGASYRFYSEGTSAPALTTDLALAAMPTTPHSVHLGTLGLVYEPIVSTLLALIEQLHGRTLISIDPNCRPSAIPDLGTYRPSIYRALASADLVKLSDEDARVLAPNTAPVDTARQLLDAGPRLVLLTHGENGAQALTQGWEFEVPAHHVEVIDTVGAGDAFAGAFLAFLRRNDHGRDSLVDQEVVRAAVEFASAVSAAVCERTGADPPWIEELAGNVTSFSG